MTVAIPLAAGLLGAVPVEPSREEARRWAVEELARKEYAAQRPGILQQLLDWVMEWLGKLTGTAATGQNGSLFAILAGVVLVLVVVAVLVAGRTVARARQAAEPAVFDSEGGTSRTHRDAADDAAARGDWRTAVVERFRAVVRELEERAVLAPQPGRTADEAAAEASRWLPALASGLGRAARLFDDVRYGDRPADAAGDAVLRDLHDRVRAARPAHGGGPDDGSDGGPGGGTDAGTAPGGPDGGRTAAGTGGPVVPS